MPFQWLTMRIGEEQERRKRESSTLATLPSALDLLHRELTDCIEAYTSVFGEEAADIELRVGKIRLTAREQKNGIWQTSGHVEVEVSETLPGFRVDRGSGDPLLIEVGLLPGEKLYYRNSDEYLTIEEMTRRILDRMLFPKLKE